MSHSSKEKLYAFERAVFLNSRSAKSAGLLAAVGSLTTLIEDLRGEEIMTREPVVADAFALVTGKMNEISVAAQTGANEIAVHAYAELVRMIPVLHSNIAAVAPAQIRGHGPTDEMALANAAERALAILGV